MAPRKRRRSECGSGSRPSRSSSYAGPLSVLLYALAAHRTSSFSPVTTTLVRRDAQLGLVSTATEEATTSKKTTQTRKTLEELFSKDDYIRPSTLKSSSYPPWLERYFEEPEESLPTAAFHELQELRTLLTRNGFSSEDVQEILQTMFYYYTPQSTSLLLGMIDFVNLIVAEHSHFQTDDQECTSPTRHCNVFASKPVILAGIVHYAECVAARQDDVPSVPPQRSPLPTLMGGETVFDEEPKVEALAFVQDFTWEPISAKPSRSSRFPPTVPMSARKIAAHAATIKRSELLARTILGVGSTRRLSKTEAESLQGLLLSNMEDWRALALRCIASLFRLEGILHQQTKQVGDSSLAVNSLLPGLRPPEVVHTAQEAILVYGTLAERLGMHQLKAKIEEKAFQILYRRQYKAVSSVYQQSGKAMHIVRSFLSKQIDTMLRSDAKLMAHIDTLEVSSRVKEPYSFWKKLLKTKAKEKSTFSLPSAADSGDQADSGLSFMEVKDGIALRVILKARKESPDETDETTRAREKLLCYYVQHLIRKQWPGDDDRLKDYIQHPKPNGYQSLHYTAFLNYHTGEHFPFEVQVRSEEMHRIAEYGVAAHWDYKLAAASTSSSGSGTSLDDQVVQAKAMFALKAAEEEESNLDETVVDVSVDAAEPEVVVDPLYLPLDGVLKASPPAPNGNALAPLSSSGILDREVAEQHSTSMDLEHETNKGKNQVEYIDALVTARKNLVQERVYVFVAGSSALTMDQGQLLILDSGSSIRDAVEYLKKSSPEALKVSVGDPLVQVATNVSAQRPSRGAGESLEPSILRNGQKAQLDDVIRNGDVLLLEF